jgi:hypothetical protein
MDNIIITSAKYVTNPFLGGNDNILAVINGETLSVPFDLGNVHYAEIMRQVDAGELTIAEAEE